MGTIVFVNTSDGLSINWNRAGWCRPWRMQFLTIEREYFDQPTSQSNNSEFLLVNCCAKNVGWAHIKRQAQDQNLIWLITLFKGRQLRSGVRWLQRRGGVQFVAIDYSCLYPGTLTSSSIGANASLNHAV
jgi:hypothetical protein